jgi:hypothetical protein
MIYGGLALLLIGIVLMYVFGGIIGLIGTLCAIAGAILLIIGVVLLLAGALGPRPARAWLVRRGVSKREALELAPGPSPPRRLRRGHRRAVQVAAGVADPGDPAFAAEGHARASRP